MGAAAGAFAGADVGVLGPDAVPRFPGAELPAQSQPFERVCKQRDKLSDIHLTGSTWAVRDVERLCVSQARQQQRCCGRSHKPAACG